jgi:hypothetical protein
MLKVIDPGHKFLLLTLDGELEQVLTFVKRMDSDVSQRYPGNTSAYPGTTMQSVIRALLYRVSYLQGQKQCDENIAIAANLMNCLYLLEHRAMRRHGFDASKLTQTEAANGKMCPTCGHVHCDCDHKYAHPNNP